MRASLLLAALAVLSACSDTEAAGDGGDNEGEVITTVVLTFTPDAGDPVVATFEDPTFLDDALDDDVTLAAGTDYTLTIDFLNALEDPPEAITDEVADEADEHQVFLTGTAVDGPATDNAGAPLTVAYADQDDGGLPLGLEHDVTAAAGAGTLVVTLRHLPPEGGAVVKEAGLAETVASEGFDAIGGDNDAQVTFDVTVE